MFRFLFFFLACCLLGCSPSYNKYLSHYNFSNRSTIPNYANINYWAAHPWKNDPSDSIPKDIKNRERDSLADVFFIYPTTYTKEKIAWNADINDASLNAKTDYSSILYQASVFNQHCRVFAPRYRQAHLSAFYTNSTAATAAFDTAYADIRNAFKFYLQHYNHSQPIFIAGHSQGAMLAKRLLQEFFDDKPLQQKLIAAYIVGWPIAPGSFKQLTVCSTPTQTGGFCGWRTFRKNYVPEYVKKEDFTSYVTNPLTWKTTTEYASREQNEGSVLRNFNEVELHTTDAQIYKGILWINKPKFPGAFLFRIRNYHIADINLFYMNLRENVQQRIFAYLKKQ